MSGDTPQTTTDKRWEVRWQRKASRRWWGAGSFDRKADAIQEMRGHSDKMTMAWIVDTWEDHYGNIVRPSA